MALLYPISNSTFGDSRQTAGSGGLRKYVLAQYQGDADLDWVKRLRTFLGPEELKYRDFHPEHRRIKSSNPDLFKAIENGIGQATVIVIDPEPIALNEYDWYVREQAEYGVDYTAKDITDICAISLLAGTPIAYLPEKLDIFGSMSATYPAVRLSGFAPEELLRKERAWSQQMAYGLAVPDTREWWKQLRKIPPAVTARLNLYLYSVGEGGVTVHRPGEEIAVWRRV